MSKIFMAFSEYPNFNNIVKFNYLVLGAKSCQRCGNSSEFLFGLCLMVCQVLVLVLICHGYVLRFTCSCVIYIYYPLEGSNKEVWGFEALFLQTQNLENIHMSISILPKSICFLNFCNQEDYKGAPNKIILILRVGINIFFGITRNFQYKKANKTKVRKL